MKFCFQKYEKAYFILAYAVLLCVCVEMFYRQSIRFNEMYASDLNTHIAFSGKYTNFPYTLLLPIIKFLLSINGSTFYLACFLAAMTAVTVYVTYLLLRDTVKTVAPAYLHALAFVCLFMNPAFIPRVNPMILGMQPAGIWHNATYLCMKCMGIAAMLLFYRIWESYLERLPIKRLIVFSALFVLSTWFKANFALVLGPAMLGLLIYDAIRYRGKKLKNQLFFGCAALPALVVLLLQYHVLVNANELKGSGTSIAIAFMEDVLEYTITPALSFVQTLAFPTLVLVYYLTHKPHQPDRAYAFAWIMWGIGEAQSLFLVDEVHKYAGNWSWGVNFCMFLIYIVSIRRFIWDVSLSEKSKKGERVRSTPQKAYFVLGGGLIVWHVASGLLVFGRFACGLYEFILP